jgi:drug/metabolite transporter (DMT)-like permease
MPYVLFLLICTVWGASFILMKKAVVCFSPASVGLARIAGGAAVLAILWWLRSAHRPVTRRDIVPLLIVVVLGFAWPYSIQPWLVARHGSAFVGMSVSFTPLATILVSIPLLRIYPTGRQLVGVLGALVCLSLLMIDGIVRQIPAFDLGLALTVPTGYAITNTVVRRSLRHVPPLELTLVSLLGAGVLLVPAVVTSTGPGPAAPREMTEAIASLAVLGIAGTGLATFYFNRLIHDHGPLFAGMATNLIPVGAMIWGWIDHERVTSLQIGALVGLLAMVALVQYGAAKAPKPGASVALEAAVPPD